MQLVYRYDVVASATANAVVGEYEKRAALELLLHGTGLEAIYSADNAATIRPADVRRTAESRSTAASSQPTITPSAAGTNGDLRADQPEPRSSTSAASLEGTRATVDQDVDLGELVVIGSRIRGVALQGPSPVLIVTAQDIENSGHATIQDYIRTIPQNYSDLTEENAVVGAIDSLGRGSAFNLRGIGADSTLVLLNGRRLAASGARNGTFVDVSTIPVSAVERLEILTDGASALYGSDAIGGVVNIHLKRQLDGIEARVRYGQDDDRDTSEQQAVASFGTSWSSGSVLAIYERFERDALLGSDRALTANMDYRSLGGADFRNTTFAQPGNIFAVSGTLPGLGAASAGIPAGQDGTALATSQLTPNVLSRSSILLSQRSLINEARRDSIVLTLEQDLGAGLVAFVDGFASSNDSGALSAPSAIVAVVGPNPSVAPHPTFGNNPFNPFTVPVRVVYSPAAELGPIESTSQRKGASIAAGLKAAVGSWDLTLSGTHGVDELNGLDVLSYNTAALNSAVRTANPALALNLFGDGSAQNMAALAGIIQPIEFLGDGRITGGSLNADGPLFGLRGGDLKAAVGAEYRDEAFDSWTLAATSTQRQGRRNTKAAYAELYVPVLPSGALWPQLVRLDLTMAGRYEEYSDFGHSFDPKFGVAFEPLRDLLLRASWGESFRAPALNELYGTTSTVTTSAVDPLRGNQPTTIQQRSGANPALEPERADTLTYGVVYRPARWRGFELEASRWQMDFEDRIIGATDIFAIFNAGRESLLPPGVVVRAAPTPADVAAGRPGQLLSIDARALNASLAELSGFDVGLRQTLNLERFGSLAIALTGSYIDNHRDTLADGLPMVEHVSTWSFPVDVRVRASATWSIGGWSTSLHLGYIDDYRNTFAQTEQEIIDSWTTADLSLAYRWRQAQGVLAGLEARLSVTNVLDEEPPFFNSPGGYDARQSSIVGRQWFASVSKRFGLRGP